MKRIRTLLAGSLLAAFAAGTALAQTHGVSDTEIVIGATVPLSGNAASIGQGWSIGARVAVDEVNAAGGINGRKLKLVLEDDGYVPAKTVQNVRKLIDVDQAFAILCTSSSAGTLSSIDYITETGTILINTLVMNSQIWATERPTTFTIGQGYPELTERVVSHMDQAEKDLKWGVFIQDDAFGENILTGVQSALTKAGKEATLVIKYKRGQQDFSAEMARMKDAGVNAIYSGAVFNEHIVLTREAKRLNMPVKFGLLFTAHNALLQKMMGEPGQDALTADTVSTLAEDNGKKFIELASKHVSPKELEGVNRDSMTAYAGTSLLIDAIGRCGKDVTKDCVVKQLEETKDFATLAMGPITFGPGVRFSNQPTRVLKNDFAAGAFVAVTDYQK